MEKYFKIILGLLFIVTGLYVLLYWMNDFVVLIKGGLGLIVLFIGLFTVLIGASDFS